LGSGPRCARGAWNRGAREVADAVAGGSRVARREKAYLRRVCTGGRREEKRPAKSIESP
jgi:hypothetical protein